MSNRLVQARTPRVILIDIDLPGMDTIKTIRPIKTTMPSVEIVALAMNGHTIYRDEITSAGASAYVRLVADVPVADIAEVALSQPLEEEM